MKMPIFNMVVTTTFTKDVQIEAQTLAEAEEKTWEWIEENDALHGADLDTSIEEIKNA
jgi:hypothetical protein